jgi:hypothetical protein
MADYLIAPIQRVPRYCLLLQGKEKKKEAPTFETPPHELTPWFRWNRSFTTYTYNWHWLPSFTKGRAYIDRIGKSNEWYAETTQTENYQLLKWLCLLTMKLMSYTPLSLFLWIKYILSYSCNIKVYLDVRTFESSMRIHPVGVFFSLHAYAYASKKNIAGFENPQAKITWVPAMPGVICTATHQSL